MSLPLSMLICLSMVHLCMGEYHLRKDVKAKKVHNVGAWDEMDSSGNDMKDAIQFAVKTFNSDFRRKRLFKLVSVTNPEAKVIDKINFKFDAILVQTTCYKIGVRDVEKCSLKKRHVKCHFRVAFDPRDNTHEMEHQHCKKQNE